MIDLTIVPEDVQNTIAAEAERWQDTRPPVEKDYISEVGGTFHMMILLERNGEEKLIDLISLSDRLVDIIKIIRSCPHYKGWMISESWEAKDEF